MGHRFIPNAPEIKKQMLAELGLKDIDELFQDIPKSLRIKNLNLPPPLSEQETKWHLKKILSKNKTKEQLLLFLGGGAWFHYIPSHIHTIVQRGEFLTAYTPYQAEASQGMLQALFEYQSLVSELVGLDIVNSSMYDWATALGEAALMCSRVTGRKRILFPRYISPERKSVLENHVSGAELEIVEIKHDRTTGQLDLADLKSKLDQDTAGVYVENPSYLGFLEEQVDEIESMVHGAGALFVVGVNPISLALIKPPGEYGADIVVGEGQPLGNPVNFGGPTLGIFACRNDRRLLRQMPGRLIGMTQTTRGDERGFSMVLQTREQHIRREQATSNICSNEALCAVAAAAYLVTMGPEGLKEVARICMANANYLMKRLSEIKGLEAPIFRATHFNEFTLKCEKFRIDDFNRSLLTHGVHGGKPLKEFPELGEAALLCTTEVHCKSDLDRFVEAVEKVTRRMR